MKRQFDARKGAWEGGRKDKSRCFPAKSSSNKERPFHHAFLVGNLPCPNETCLNSPSTYSWEGIDHRYRAIHKNALNGVRKIDLHTFYLFINFRDLRVR